MEGPLPFVVKSAATYGGVLPCAGWPVTANASGNGSWDLTRLSEWYHFYVDVNQVWDARHNKFPEIESISRLINSQISCKNFCHIIRVFRNIMSPKLRILGDLDCAIEKCELVSSALTKWKQDSTVTGEAGAVKNVDGPGVLLSRKRQALNSTDMWA